MALFAAQTGSRDCIQPLIDAGTMTDCINNDGYKPLDLLGDEEATFQTTQANVTVPTPSLWIPPAQEPENNVYAPMEIFDVKKDNERRKKEFEELGEGVKALQEEREKELSRNFVIAEREHQLRLRQQEET